MCIIWNNTSQDDHTRPRCGRNDLHSCTKWKRPNISSPDAEILLQSKTIDICGHCNKRCTEKGPQSEALQCDMCYSWVHATCEGLKKDQYKQFTQLTNTITNIVYYCTLNQCASLNKKLIYDHLSSLKQNADTTTLRSLKVEQTNLHRTISDVLTNSMIYSPKIGTCRNK